MMQKPAAPEADTAPPSLLLRDATRDDGEAITALFGRVFGTTMALAEWRWKYRAETGDLFSAVAVTADGQVVAHVGALRGEGWDGQQGLPVWQFVDAMVDPPFRRRDLFQALIDHVCVRIAAGAPAAMLYAFAGPDSKRIGHGKGFLTPVLQVQQHAVACRAIGRGGFGWSLRPTAIEDPRFASLWAERMRGVPVFALRDAAYLRWRFVANTRFSYQGALLRRFGRPRGWLIWSRQEQTIHLVDCCLDKTDLAAALRMLAAQAADCEQIDFWLPDDWVRGTGLPVTTTTTAACLMLFNAAPAHLLAEARAPRMFFTMADVDIF